MARCLKLILAYDGTAFSGWQRQAGTRTVQAVLEDALRPMADGDFVVTAAGRTDAGVHAAGQVVSVTLTARLQADDLQRALNATLPGDVRILAASEAPEGFDARHAARFKTYHYRVWNGAAVPPLARGVVWHILGRLDLEAMNRAAARLVGEHDFAAFQSTGSAVRTTTRRLIASAWRDVDWRADAVGTFGAPERADASRLLCYEVTGTGFLRHMVRTIVGTLVDIGLGRQAPEHIVDVLASQDRARAGQTAPPQGLTLWRVDY